MARLLAVSIAPAIGIAFGLALLVALSPTRASADAPSPLQSIIDDVIVGDVSGDLIFERANGCVANPPGFYVEVRDFSGTPAPGASVTLDFSLSSVRLYQTQNTGTTVNCTLEQITQIADGQGRVVFGPRIGRSDNLNSVGVYADGVLLKQVPARSTDIDGIDGVTGLNDFQFFASNFSSGSFDPSTNFDNCVSGIVVTGLNDFSIFTAQYVTAATGVYCP